MDQFVNLTAGNINYTGPHSLVQFTIEDTKMMLHSSKHLVAQITFKRMFVYHVVATFVPSLLLMIVALIMLFVDHEEHFDAIIGVHLTTMLVMYTLYAAIAEGMPPTAYLKFIDIWLMYGIALPFCTFLIAVLAKLLNHYQTQHRQDTANNTITLVGNETIAEVQVAGRLRLETTTASPTLREVHQENTKNNEAHIQRAKTTELGNHLIHLAQIVLPTITLMFIAIYAALAMLAY